MPYDIGLDPDTGDLPTISSLISGIDLVAQRVRIRLGLIKGDSVRDKSLGLPWVDWMSTKPVRLRDIETQTRLAVESVPGVVRTENWTATHDPQTRSVTLSGQVFSTFGEIDVDALAEAREGNLSFKANFWGPQGAILP